MEYKKRNGIYQVDRTPNCVLDLHLGDGYCSVYGDPVVYKVFDHSDSHNHGTVDGATPAYPGFSFDGQDDFINCGNHSSLNITGAITIEAWMKTSYSGIQVLLTKWMVTAYYEVIYDSNNRVYMYLKGTNGTASGNLDSTALNDNKWHHIVVVFDFSNYATAYIDGAVGDNPRDISGVGDASNTSNLYIGTEVPSLWPFNGTIDDVRIWNIALSANQIKSNYEIGRGNYGT